MIRVFTLSEEVVVERSDQARMESRLGILELSPQTLLLMLRELGNRKRVVTITGIPQDATLLRDQHGDGLFDAERNVFKMILVSQEFARVPPRELIPRLTVRLLTEEVP